jgi:hypothetical protein
MLACMFVFVHVNTASTTPSVMQALVETSSSPIITINSEAGENGLRVAAAGNGSRVPRERLKMNWTGEDMQYCMAAIEIDDYRR